MNLDKEKLTKTFLKAFQESNDMEGRNLKEMNENEEIGISINSEYFDNYLLLITIVKLIKEGHIELKVNESIPIKKIEYLNKLMKWLKFEFYKKLKESI